MPAGRQVERATYRDVALRSRCAHRQPDHDTICAFRRNNLGAIAAAFVEGRELAKELQLLKLGTVSLDGTPIRASASKDQNVTCQRAPQLRLQLRRRLRALLRKREKRPGYGLSEADRRRWPNRWFAAQGLSSLEHGSCA